MEPKKKTSPFIGVKAIPVKDHKGRHGFVLTAHPKRRHDFSKLYDYEPIPLDVPKRGLFARRRPWVLAALALVLLWAAWLNTKPAPPEPGWVGLPQGEDAPDALLQGFRLISSTRGVKQWELYAQSAQLYQKKGQAFAEQINVEYYRNNRVISTLTADKGIINTLTNDTFVDGHVELKWDSKSEMITSDARVHIYKGLDDITAVGMVADARLDNVKFVRDVHTRVRDTREIERFDKRKRF
jgi:lipopolysaccharide export system protein LptC